MKQIIISLIVVMTVVVMMPSRALSASKPVLISEVQTGSLISAGEEFIEIFNSSTSVIDVSGWSLYYRSATGVVWSKKGTIASGSVDPGDFWILAANTLGDSPFTSGLAQSGGSIELRDKQGAAVDLFGWGTANTALIAPGSESKPGESMYRLYDFGLKEMVNSDNNFADFDLSNSPTPGMAPAQEIIEVEEPVQTYPNLELSELFPDPASPLSDASDEFIEIYNPTAEAVDLSGWKLRDESGGEYLIKGKTILAYGRIAIMSSESKITLNNTGDIILLIDPNDKVADESGNYGAAEEGLGWTKQAGQWQWSISPTPGAANSAIYIDSSLSPASSVANIKKSSTKKPASKTITKAKAKAKAKTKISKLKVSPNSSSNPASYPTDANKTPASGLWAWLLVSLGIATIGYGIYEYRTEIQLQFKKLRSKF